MEKKEELQLVLLEFVKRGNCFTQKTREVLLEYKKLGGTQNDVVKVLYKMKEENITNQTIQHAVDDILDIATGYCGIEMRVW
ncbi:MULTISPECIES: hypothetical protein [Tenacibaculum]|uniref:hypothetical protein n=1 Tax=Tenacibaculum TaxID=104267 RepID=UPI000DE87CF2|nr:hypothetical protein [Tenacibaculum sp. E3R01]RBW62933.1 hypothetical protein DS884_01055 [Tenacibaculum sp. E3R01]